MQNKLGLVFSFTFAPSTSDSYEYYQENATEGSTNTFAESA